MVIEAIQHELEKLGHTTTDYDHLTPARSLTYQKLQKYDNNWSYVHTCTILHTTTGKLTLIYSDGAHSTTYNQADPAFNPQDLIQEIHNWLTKD